MDIKVEEGLIFSKECKFVVGANNFSAIPQGVGDFPEFAFVGRSNVGKSTLINALVNRRGLARTSNTPGRTQQINIFLLADVLYLADLPGYGYAGVSKAMRKSWGSLISSYLKTRYGLKRVFLLVDSRRGIMQKDEEMMEMLCFYGVVFQIILTKIDKLNKAELEAVEKDTYEKANHFPAMYPEIICVSADKKIGINKLRNQIEGFVFK